ncbi:class I SAM-dependent methyltransferase [Sulfurimonas sp. MAG313]|nr:class I SAM-dependent methyltransferase [Sulfurimonas sp. MAG313]MDF1881339.1 class I SAM-dependent methyltransferase [Sulfurimonas sp. MAG313]
MCHTCCLVFVSKEEYLDEKSEKARYDLHTNSSEDKNYRIYLSKVFNPVQERIKKGYCGLDFGSGPGPTLSKMFEEAGYKMNIYDHFYAKDEHVLYEGYDFITSTEVVEHLYSPKEVLDALWTIVKKDGLLCLLTQVYPSQENFSKWYYKNDPTHVCFFSDESMRFMAKKWKASLEIVHKDVFIFKKS